MNKKSILRSLFFAALVLVMLASACGRVTPQPLPLPVDTEPSPTQPQPTPTLSLINASLAGADDPLTPRVTGQNPSSLEEAAPDAAFEIYFDQSMDQVATEAALEVRGPDGEAVSGQVSWPEGRVMRFKPFQSLRPAARYQASLQAKAASAQGVPLSEGLTLEFQTAGDLTISQVTPANGTVEVDPNAVITVIFNRPVVPLMTAEEQANLPQPLEISPAVAGHGEWLNTSVYVFRLDTPLTGSTTYQARVNAGLTDTLGMQLIEDYAWSFTTVAPGINALTLPNLVWGPPDDLADVPLNQSFTISFLQPMDIESTEAAFALLDPNGAKQPVSFAWSESATEMTVSTESLMALDTRYSLIVDRSAQAKTGGGLRDGLEWHFTTVVPPAVRYTTPYDGQVQAEYYGMLEIYFASPMKQASLVDKVIITPEPEGGAEWMYTDWSMFFYGLQPSTYYTVEVLPEMEDVYGNATQHGYTFHFTTAAYPASARLVMPYYPALFRAGGPQEFYASYTNISSADFALYSLTPQEFIKALDPQINMSEFVPQESSLIRRGSITSTAARNERTFKPYSLVGTDDQPVPPGFYFLTLDSPQVRHDSRVLDARLLVVATANLTFKSTPTEALVWLTDLKTGLPVANAPVTIYDNQFNALGSGETGDDGLVTLDLPLAENTFDPRYAIAGSGSEEVFAAAGRDWSDDFGLYEKGIWTDFYSAPGAPSAYIYTDRPLYRPGQTVYFKGVVRINDDLHYSLPGETEIDVTIDSFGEYVYSNTLTLTQDGTFEGSLTLDENAALGEYALGVRFPGGPFNFGWGSFNVAEYRKPEFMVEVTAAPEDVLAGENFEASAQADFYSGGPVSGAEVSWVLAAEPYFFEAGQDYMSYSFYDDELDVNPYFMENGGSSRLISQGSGETDSQGRLEMTLPAELSDTKGSQNLTFEATVIDLTGNPVSGRATVTAHQSMWYPGVKPERYVGEAGKEQAFEIVLLDWDSQPVPGGTVNVEIVERRWSSVQEEDAQGRLRWVSAVEDVPVETFEGVTLDENGHAAVQFTPDKGGVYRARVTSRDTHGNEAAASAYLWIAGDEYISWRQDNDRTFELVADQSEYQPGDTAEILIASPFQGNAYALVTVERGHIIQQDVVELESNSTIYRLPITADLAPNAYVSVVVVQGADQAATGPGYKIGMTEIKVDRSQQALNVQISTDRTEVGPGEDVVYTIYTEDANGQPVSADVSLSLVDLAVLSLTGPNSIPMIDHFYPHRYLGVMTAVALSFNMEEYNAQLTDQLPEGQGMGSGGGKGGGEYGVIEVRGDFRDTAYWRGSLTTDADGRATVRITLPDNLTTWRMDARAVTPDTRVGQSTFDILSTRPLLVRPQTPRFFVAGDRAWLSAAVHNNTGEDLDVAVSLGAEGVVLEDAGTQNVSVPAFSQAVVGWNVTVAEGATRVDLKFSAAGGDYSDASLPTMGTLEGQGIPVYRFEAPETVGTAGTLTEAGYRVEAVSLPVFDMERDLGIDPSGPQDSSLTIEMAPSLAAGMTNGLTYLADYPFDCTEQTVSRFLPNVLTTRALQKAGISDPDLQTHLDEQVSLSLQRLYNQQHIDGGWGWWSMDPSDDLVTAYVVFGLVEARDSGYPVDEDVLTRGLRFLTDGKLAVRSLASQWELNRIAFIYYVEARAGHPNTSQTVQLFDIRQKLSVYAQAFLALTLHQIDASDPRIQTILSDLNSRAALSATGAHWDEEGDPDYLNWNTNTRTTAIVLSALARIDPDNQLNPNAVRWLMANRTSGRWEGTQETAWSLMALTDWMEASGEMQASYHFEAALNGAGIASGNASPETLRSPVEVSISADELLGGEVNRLVIARDEGAGNLYYTAHLKVSLPVDQIPALERGMAVSRDYLSADETHTPVTEANQGDVFLARITIIAPHDLHYVVIEDPLPAGLEPVDSSLLTSLQTGAPPLDDWDSEAYGGYRGWGWWYFRHVELRDEKVVLSVDYLPAGTYEYVYRVRAATPGDYSVIPTTGHEFYFPEVYGRGEGVRFVVRP